MADSVPAGWFQWVVGLAVLLITGLVGASYASLSSGISELKTDMRDLRLEISSVGKQTAGVNTRLDTLIELTRNKQ
jgi:hypothetical protein